MQDKFIFNEDIKRVYNCISNSQIISQYILKDYISDIKIFNDNKKKEKIIENNSIIITNNSKNLGKYNDSSQNLIALKANNSIYPITTVNNSFLYFNSSFKSLNLDKLEGLIIECNWKKKYILLLKISKINDSEQFYKSIEIECLEMNHLENAFNIEILIFWDSTALQTILLIKLTTKIKIVEEIIKREFNNKDKKRIYNNISSYLNKDLTNIEHCATSLIFANMKDISSYLSDIRKIIKLSKGINNKSFEVYTSPLFNSMQNCRIYDINNNLCQEFILTGYYANKNRICQISWEKKVNNKIYCIYRMSIIYLEENLSLLVFRNIWETYVPSQFVSEVNILKKTFFNDIKNYFIQKNGLTQIEGLFYNDEKDLSLKIGVKNYQKKENNQINLDMIMNHEEIIKNFDTKNKANDSQYDSFLLNNSGINNKNNDIQDKENLLTDTIQNISEIENMNSNFFGNDDENNI